MKIFTFLSLLFLCLHMICYGSYNPRKSSISLQFAAKNERPWGFQFSDQWYVTEVDIDCNNSQAKTFGIKMGWKIKQVDGVDISRATEKDLLYIQKKLNFGLACTIVFEKVEEYISELNNSFVSDFDKFLYYADALRLDFVEMTLFTDKIQTMNILPPIKSYAPKIYFFKNMRERDQIIVQFTGPTGQNSYDEYVKQSFKHMDLKKYFIEDKVWIRVYVLYMTENFVKFKMSFQKNVDHQIFIFDKQFPFSNFNFQFAYRQKPREIGSALMSATIYDNLDPKTQHGFVTKYDHKKFEYVSVGLPYEDVFLINSYYFYQNENTFYPEIDGIVADDKIFFTPNFFDDKDEISEIPFNDFCAKIPFEGNSESSIETYFTEYPSKSYLWDFSVQFQDDLDKLSFFSENIFDDDSEKNHIEKISTDKYPKSTSSNLKHRLLLYTENLVNIN